MGDPGKETHPQVTPSSRWEGDSFPGYSLLQMGRRFISRPLPPLDGETWKGTSLLGNSLLWSTDPGK